MSSPIILFDGVCNFCNNRVNFIIKQDKKKVFLFTPLQSETGKKYIEQFHLENKDSFILIHNDRYYLRADASIMIAKHLGGYWLPVYYFLKIIPRFIRDGVYKIIARNRYRWFGKKDSCMIPAEEVRERFL